MSPESIPDMHWRMASQPSPWYELVKDPTFQEKILKALDKAMPEPTGAGACFPAATVHFDLETVRNMRDLRVMLDGVCMELTKRLESHGIGVRYVPGLEGDADAISIFHVTIL